MTRLGPNFLVLLSLGLSLFLAALDQTVVAAAMPVIASDLGGLHDYAWISISYLAASALFLPVSGLMSDRWGRKKTLAAGLIGFAIASVWCGVRFIPCLTPMNEFISARLLQGASAGVVLSSVFIVIADLYSPAQRGRYQGLFAAVWALSSLAGPYAGGWIAEHQGWRWIFFINVPVALIALGILLPAYVPELHDAWRHPYSKAEILSLFTNSTVVISIVSVFVSGMGMYGATALIPLIFHTTMGMGPEKSGQLLTPLVLVTCGFSVAGGLYLSKFKRYKKLVITGLSLMAAGTFALLSMPASGMPIFLAGLMTAGAGLGLLLPVYTIIIQSVVPQEVLGMATGVSQFTRCAGGAFGTCSMGVVLSRLPFVQACTTVFVFYGALLVITALLNMIMREVPLRGRRVPDNSTNDEQSNSVPVAEADGSPCAVSQYDKYLAGTGQGVREKSTEG